MLYSFSVPPSLFDKIKIYVQEFESKKMISALELESSDSKASKEKKKKKSKNKNKVLSECASLNNETSLGASVSHDDVDPTCSSDSVSTSIPPQHTPIPACTNNTDPVAVGDPVIDDIAWINWFLDRMTAALSQLFRSWCYNSSRQAAAFEKMLDDWSTLEHEASQV
jgi:hypothetical protein